MISHVELVRQSDRIVKLIDDAEKLFDEDDEMRSHMAKYICVLCSGFLENAVYHIYTEYVRSQTPSEPVRLFLSETLRKILNPNSDKLRSIAKQFCSSWETDLKDYIQIDDRATAINYIIKERHRIAHGQDSDITLARVRNYHTKALQVVKFIESQCEAELGIGTDT